LLGFAPERFSRKNGEENVAQGPVRRRVKRPSDDVSESGTAAVSSMMEPIALTKVFSGCRGPGALQSVTAT